ncbi:hypothetical protein T492DRAFT_842228 [Pavlovales sp. CCMP2436]|nr:hypothetical protein T492DRAFT_842228 [Pavlovales sp. CCMP2436]
MLPYVETTPAASSRFRISSYLPSPTAFVKPLTTPSRDRRNVAVTLSWAGGGSSVFLIGSFTNWRERVPMVAEEGNTHFATVHLRAGEHQYLFEVNGVLCISNLEHVAGVSGLIVNTVVVDDGSEYEELGGKAARSESPMQIDDDGMAPSCSARADADSFSTTVPTNLTVAWDEPPPLPAALARVHGVPQTAASRRIRRIIWPEGRPHAVLEDCALNHAASARCDDAAGNGADDKALGLGSSPEIGLPEIGRLTMTVSVTSRWRTHRVTNVLLKPAPARTELLSDITLRRTLKAVLSEIASRRTTSDPVSAAIRIPQSCLRTIPRPAPRKQSDESMDLYMGESEDVFENESMGEFSDYSPHSPPLQFEPMDGVPTLSEMLSSMCLRPSARRRICGYACTAFW